MKKIVGIYISYWNFAICSLRGANSILSSRGGRLAPQRLTTCELLYAIK